jgi:hypothetical protein
MLLPLRVYADNKDLASKFTKLHSYVLYFLNEKTKIHINFGDVLWVAFNSVGLIITHEIPYRNRTFH